MKKYTFIIMLLSISFFVSSQYNYDKISSTEGNFSGVISSNDRFGIGVEAVGDINNDGIEDMVVGARTDDDGGTDRGAVWIMFMDTNMNVGSYQKISSTQGNFTGSLSNDDQFGTAIASLGDLDNDGVPDIVVGAWGDDDVGNESGAAWVLFLNSDGTVKSHQKISATQGNLVGLTSNRHFGLSLCSAGDINNDGNTDIVVGTPPYDNDGGLYKGCIWVLFLNANGTVASQQKINDYNGNFNVTLDNNDRFGYGLSNIGDLDNDGVNDIVVGALYDDDGGTDIGAVYILFLNANGTVKSQQKISATQGSFTGLIETADRFGYAAVGIGDADNDGILDIAVGAYSDDDGGSGTGAVWLIYLNNDGTCKGYEKISKTSGNFNGVLDNDDNFGVALSSFHDINSNGGIQLIVGTVNDDDGGTDKGAAWIIHLKEPNGINNLYFNKPNISIYPNPTAGKITVEAEGIESIEVINLQGKQIYIGKETQIEISQNPKGIYIIKVRTDKGVVVEKIVLK